MIEGLLAKKIGMTHLFAAESRVIPVTVLQVAPNVVTQIKTATNDGYEAVQVGSVEAKQVNGPARGHLKASGGQKLRHLHEFKSVDSEQLIVGQVLDVTRFQVGDLVDVTALTKGRGFQGVMKRHGFGGGPKTHGQGDRGRSPGSIGAGTYPGRVIKGKEMPGHMGTRQVTIRRLRVELVDPEKGLLMLHGAVPGPRSGLVRVRYAKGSPIAERVQAETVDLVEDAIEAAAEGSEEILSPAEETAAAEVDEAPAAEAGETVAAEVDEAPVAEVEETAAAEVDEAPVAEVDQGDSAAGGTKEDQT